MSDIDKIVVTKKDETYMLVHADRALSQEIKEFFTFEVPGAKYNPKVKEGIWNGKISLLNLRTKEMYIGLLSVLSEFCKSRSYELVIDPELVTAVKISPDELVNFIKDLNIHSGGKPLSLRDYQVVAIYTALTKQRRTLLSPTASGKSYILYCIVRWLIKQYPDLPVLLVVPNVGLVGQMLGDFSDYSSENGYPIDDVTQTISAGQSKTIQKTTKIVISTWQSIYKESSRWFNQFSGVLVDEVHLAQATSIKTMMEHANQVAYRIGCTGTLSDTKTHELVITGLFGKVTRVTTTSELMKKNVVASIKVNCVVLNYTNPDERKAVKSLNYHDELDYICKHDKRNNFIAKMALNSTGYNKGNTLVLFNYVEKHGKVIYDLIMEMLPPDSNRKVFFIWGKVPGEDRNLMRKIVETEDDAIIVASYGTLSTGTNIKRLHNIITASPTKSIIRLLQSIGRGLRKAEGKDELVWIDIVDKFSTKNFAYQHFVERLRIYNDEKFEYKITTVNF